MTLDYQLLAHFPIQERIRYSLRSYTHYRANLITRQYYRLALQLPKGKHPRTRVLAAQWRQEYRYPKAIVQRALRYFNQEPFIYTRTPDLLLNDPIDEFLFETRRGFCEHYAAAFTLLMRAADIPARVVTGYLGGRVNPIDHYLIVRQRDAHAWTEIWLQNKGWVRIDPTGAIAPTRIEQGIDTALPAEFNPLGFEINFGDDSIAVKTWQHLHHTWEAINNRWHQWVLGYGPAQQKKLLNHLGFEDINWRGMIMLLVFIIASLWLGYAVWMLLRFQWGVNDPAQHLYLRLCKKLARHGFVRHPSEGPFVFAARIGAVRPDLAVSIRQIIELYVQTRYRSQFQILPQLRKAVQQFRL